MADMTAELINNGRRIRIEMDVEEEFLPSKKSGMTLLIASTHGTQQVPLTIQNSRVRISANVFIPNPAYNKKTKPKHKKVGIDLSDI